MRKTEKAEIVQELQERIGRSQFNILADFTGLKVEEITRLRRQVRDADGELRVVKNTLLSRAAGEGTPVASLSSHFVGPNAMTFGYGDPVALAKVLVKFAQEKPQFKLKAGVLSGQVLTAQEVDALSKLPDREILLAQLLGVLQAPARNLVTVLAAVIRNFLNVLVAIKEQKEKSEPAAAPAPEAPAASEEPAATEAPEAAAASESAAAPEAPEASAAPAAADSGSEEPPAE